MKRVFKLVVCVMVLILFSACGKRVLTTKEFLKEISKTSFITTDITKRMKDGTIISAYAVNNGEYQFEYYEYKDSNSAINAYNNDKKTLNDDGNKIKETKNGEYTKSVKETEETYNVIVKNKNTLIYASVSKEYKRNLNKTLGKLGY